MGASNRPKLCYTPKERRDYGVIATLVNTETGDTLVEHVGSPHTTQEAVRVVAAMCDRLGPEWKVRTISHPLSILADLRNEGRERPPQTELTALGRIGRGDLREWQSPYLGLRTRAELRRRRRL